MSCLSCFEHICYLLPGVQDEVRYCRLCCRLDRSQSDTGCDFALGAARCRLAQAVSLPKGRSRWFRLCRCLSAAASLGQLCRCLAAAAGCVQAVSSPSGRGVSKAGCVVASWPQPVGTSCVVASWPQPVSLDCVVASWPQLVLGKSCRFTWNQLSRFRCKDGIVVKPRTGMALHKRGSFRKQACLTGVLCRHLKC